MTPIVLASVAMLASLAVQGSTFKVRGSAFEVQGSTFEVQGSQANSLTARFHHIHYDVPDPSEAMADVVAKYGGTREIVSGLGVGVRHGDHFWLFDRMNVEGGDRPQPVLTKAYEQAVAWLQTKGIRVDPAGLDHVSRAPSDRSRGFYHHIAFVVPAFERALTLIGTPLTRREDSAIYDAGDGVLVEIVRETGLPDAFWCPMHVDVRAPAAGKCPQCGMDLVPIPPPKVGEYKLDVALQRTSKGASGMRLTVRDPDTNAVVTQFETIHEKLFHLFLVSRDLEHFAHVHPEAQRNGSFALKHPLPPGEYMVIADFVPVGGTAQTLQRAVMVGGIGPRSKTRPASSGVVGRVFRPGTLTVTETAVDGLRVALKVEDMVPGKEACLTFTLSDEKTGQPITDLQPYLGAPAHMLMVRGDLGDAVHAHPEELQTGGPRISFHPLIPAEGDYKLWLQVQRAGRVITVPFWLAATR